MEMSHESVKNPANGQLMFAGSPYLSYIQTCFYLYKYIHDKMVLHIYKEIA